MLYDAKSDAVKSISGLGVWPALASREYFNNNCNGEIPAGILRSVVPAAPDAWLTALELYGTMSFEQVVQPSLEAARHGFPVSDSYVGAVDTHIEELKSWSHTSDQFLPGGCVVIMKEADGGFGRLHHIPAERFDCAEETLSDTQDAFRVSAFPGDLFKNRPEFLDFGADRIAVLLRCALFCLVHRFLGVSFDFVQFLGGGEFFRNDPGPHPGDAIVIRLPLQTRF